MDGLKVKVKTNDGKEALYSLRPKTLVAFENKYNKGFAKLLSDDLRLEQLYFLAWAAMKDSGVVVKPFGDAFLDTLLNVELEADPNLESTEIA